MLAEDKKTIKTKYIRIDNKFVYTDIIFSINSICPDTLEMHYILHAVNGEFISLPLVINLTGDTSGLVNELNRTNLFVKLKWQEDDYRFTNSCLKDQSFIHIYKNKMKDDMGREYITFEYMSTNNEIVAVNIPIVIYPTFVSTLIDIINRKDILECNEQENNQHDKEDKSTDTDNDIQQ